MHNVDSLLVRDASTARVFYPYVKALEHAAIQCSERIMVVSETDKKIIGHMYPSSESKISVVPNGVNITRHACLKKSTARKRIGFPNTAKIVLFHGLLSWKPNADAAREILDIASRLPHLTFLVIGKNPPKPLIWALEKTKNARMPGFVPNIQDYISAADICLVPIRTGSGTRLKLLEYLCAMKPIVTTRKAAEGIELPNVPFIRFFETSDEAIEQIETLLNLHDRQEIYESMIRQWVSKYDWNCIAKIFEKELEHALERHELKRSASKINV